MAEYSTRRKVIMMSLWAVMFYGAYQLIFAKSDLASALEDEYAFNNRNWDIKVATYLMTDSAYGKYDRLNPYEQGEKRVYYYFPSIDITFEVSGEGAVNPDYIVGVIDGKKEL